MNYTIIRSVYNPNISKMAKDWIENNINVCMQSPDEDVLQYSIDDIMKKWNTVKGFPQEDMEEILTIKDFEFDYIEF